MTIEDYFPSLPLSGFRRISDASEKYNCVAWAAGHDDEWWDIAEGYYWPEDVPREAAVQHLVKVYELLGFVRCESDRLEDGFEKVAVYSDGYLWTHAARQLQSGK